jgi:predicted ATPase
MGGLAALVVIDNCEHLMNAVRALVEAIGAKAPMVRVLATSQEPLRIPSENLLRLCALTVPPRVAAGVALDSPAVELFCARAKAADPRFELTDGNHEAVIEICRHLDGIPLAIELAAGRIVLLGLEGLRKGLDDRLRLLTTHSPQALRQHRTLLAALEWSHGLLSPPEQAVFRRLGVFAGRFTLQAAQQVTADETIDGWAALDHLGSLVDKSLVIVDGDSDAMPRYRLLETTRLFALEQMAAAGETTSVKCRHALATLAILENVDRQALTLTGDALEDHLRPELDNVRAALAWAAGAEGDPIIGFAVVARSTWLWEALDLGAEGIAHMLTFERCAADPTSLELQVAYWRARLLHNYGFGNALNTQRVAARSIEVARRWGDPPVLYDVLIRSVIVAARSGQVELARRQLADARALENTSWPARQRAARYLAEAECLEALDELQEAHAAQTRRIELLTQAGARTVELHAQAQLVALELALGDTDAAVARGRRALADAGRQFPPFRTRALQLSLAQALVAKGQLDDAIQIMKTGVPLLKGPAGQWQALDVLAELWAKLGDAARAARILACADRVYEMHGFSRKPYANRARARLLASLGEAVPAADLRRLRKKGAELPEDDALTLAMDF